MNKLNKELLDRALVEGVESEECFNEEGLVLSFFWQLYKFYFVFPAKSSSWTDVCTKEEYLAAKAEKETMIDTKSEYDIGCYYEFSDYADFSQSKVLQLSRIPDKDTFPYQAYLNGTLEVFKYIRPLTNKAGEIRKPKPLSGFVNVYNDRCHPSPIHKTKGIADEYCNPEARLACIDLSQFNEGEGL